MSDLLLKRTEFARPPAAAPPPRPGDGGASPSHGRALVRRRPARVPPVDELRGRMAEAGQRIASLLRGDHAVGGDDALCGAGVTYADLERARDEGRVGGDDAGDDGRPARRKAAAEFDVSTRPGREWPDARALDHARELEASRRALEAQRLALEALSAREREARRQAEFAVRARDELAAFVADELATALRAVAARALRARGETDPRSLAEALRVVGRRAAALAEAAEARPGLGAGRPPAPTAAGAGAPADTPPAAGRRRARRPRAARAPSKT
jgi:hypothetical protein